MALTFIVDYRVSAYSLRERFGSSGDKVNFELEQTV